MLSKREIRIAYHLVDIRNWKSIQSHGLLSTQILVERSTNVDRSMLQKHRTQGMYLDFGTFIRDQGPAPGSEAGSADCLQVVNSMVYFWLDLGRLNRDRLVCRSHKQVVLAIDAGRLLDEYSRFASVTAIATGEAMRSTLRRNQSVFVPYEKWVQSGWHGEQAPDVSSGPRDVWPTELTITGGVPDIMRFVIGSVYLDADEPLSGRHIATAARMPGNQ